MPRFILFSSLVAALVCVSLYSPPAKAGELRSYSNVTNSHPPRYSKHWRKRGKLRRHRTRRGRTYRRHRESRDYLVTFPHSRVHMGTNM